MTPAIPEGIVLGGGLAAARGRHVAAARTFRAGEAIARFGAPGIAIPDSPRLATTCSGCLSPSASRAVRAVRACTGCRAVAYCSPACQRLDWAAAAAAGGGHKAECRVFRRVREGGHDVLPTPVRALVQVLLRPEVAAAVAGMQGHVDRFRRAGGGGAWADMELEARAALHYLRREANAQALAEAVDVLCKLQVNCFSRLDEDVEQTGLFMNPALAMVNHSCTPNAFVQFAGREAVLHAYRAIEKGEEIEISYIDCNLHLSNRQEALQTRYHFTCSCPRCKDDLDPYQVCQKYPHLDLNNLSVAPEVSKVRDSQAPGLFSGSQSLSATIEEIYPWCAASLQDLSEPDQRKQLRRRWKACGPLRDPGVRAYAVEPLPLVLAEAGMYLGGRGDFAAALCVAAFRAVHADPYANPAPFAPARVKGLLLVAKLLAHTAPAPAPTTPGRDASSSPGGRPRANVSVALAAMDQVTMCQALLELVAYHAPAAHSKGWRVAREASDLLDDIEALPGRDTEGALVKAFIRNPDGAEERRFFEQAVLGPLRDLAGFCLNIMDEEFGP